MSYGYLVRTDHMEAAQKALNKNNNGEVREALRALVGHAEPADYYPWRVEVIDRTDMDHIAAREGERIAHPGWTTFWDKKTEKLVYDPRA